MRILFMDTQVQQLYTDIFQGAIDNDIDEVVVEALPDDGGIQIRMENDAMHMGHFVPQEKRHSFMVYLKLKLGMNIDCSGDENSHIHIRSGNKTATVYATSHQGVHGETVVCRIT